MPKYRVEMGSLVTKYMHRQFRIEAPDEETAIERAERKFRKACESQVYTECGDTVEVNEIIVID